MNKIFLYYLSAVFALLTVACDNYDYIYEDEYASVVRLSIFGETKVTINDDDPEVDIDFKILRSGFDIDRTTTAIVREMTEEEWNSYANTYGVQRYYRAPKEVFTLGENGTISFVFAPKEYYKETKVTVDVEKLNEYAGSLPPQLYPGEEWENVIIVPLVLEAEGGSVYSEQKNLILRLRYVGGV